MPNPPSPQSVRLTIAVTPEVHATFKRMADATGMSISKAMGEWLGDTIEAAEFMATRVEQARAAPKMVIAEMQALTAGMGDELAQLMSDVRSGKKLVPPRGGQVSDGRRAAVPASPTPRSVIRGGKSPGKTRARAHDEPGSETK